MSFFVLHIRIKPILFSGRSHVFFPFKIYFNFMLLFIPLITWLYVRRSSRNCLTVMYWQLIQPNLSLVLTSSTQVDDQAPIENSAAS